MLDTRVETEDARLSMGQPDALSPPKEEKAKQVLQSRSRRKIWGLSLDMDVACVELRARGLLKVRSELLFY
jgi:hypothetical protein